MKRLALILTASALIAGAPVYAAQDIAAIQSSATDVVNTLSDSLPFNSTIGLNWSDAYIGQLVGVPPHFGFGVTAGATFIDAKGITNLMSAMGNEVDLDSKIPLPAATAELRIGGFWWPFDLGVKAGYLPKDAIDVSSGTSVNYLLAGFDVRYPLLKGGIIMPKVSVGLGFNYMKGGVSTNMGAPVTYEYVAGADTYTAEASSPTVGVDWQASVLDFKIQASKSLIIFTPYVGLGVSYAKTTAGYSIDSDVAYKKNGTGISGSDLAAALEAGGISVPDLSSTGISYDSSSSGFGARAFGGFSVNMVVLFLDFGGMYNFTGGDYGAVVGLRFQL